MRRASSLECGVLLMALLLIGVNIGLRARKAREPSCLRPAIIEASGFYRGVPN